MISRIGTEAGVEAPEALRALDSIWDDDVEQRRLSRKLKQPRILDLHLVPQLRLADVEGAFPCLQADFPYLWKQQVRQLRNRLTHFDGEVLAREKSRVNVLGFVSVKGTVDRKGLAANLAFSLASMEETRVLLIDANPSRPLLGAKMGQAGGRGLCEALRAEREELPHCFSRIAGTQFYLLPFGQPRGYDGDALDLRGLQRLVAGLRQQFDWILIDGPGFDTPADATLVTLVADGTVYVIEQGVDRFEDLRLALKQTQGRYMIGAVMM